MRPPTGHGFRCVRLTRVHGTLRRSGDKGNYNWASGGCSILSEFGTLDLEFQYLSDLTGDEQYRNRVLKIRDTLNRMEKTDGMYPVYLQPTTGHWGIRT